MSDNRRTEALNSSIEELLININSEVEAERHDTAWLLEAENRVIERRQALVEKRENLVRLERKAVFLLAVKAVEELPQGTQGQRYARFHTLAGANGITIGGVNAGQLDQILIGTADEAYTTVLRIL